MTDALAAASRLIPRFAARASGYDVSGEFPVDDFADLRDAGLLGLLVPTRLGGLGAGFADYTAVAHELARGNGATALVYNMHASVTGALAGIPEPLIDALGIPTSFLQARDRLLADAAAGPGAAPDLTAKPGKDVLELAVTDADKGAALVRLRGELGADAVLYLGDDVTDEDAFRALGDDGVTIKVGDGDTVAAHRVPDLDGVRAVLERLVTALRA